jgi:hypothetical protein
MDVHKVKMGKTHAYAKPENKWLFRGKCVRILGIAAA